MKKLPAQKLFLLEFLLYNIEFNEKCPCDVGLRNTSVSIQFLDHEPMVISEDDFTPHKNCTGETDAFKSGKSCIFSLNPRQSGQCQKKFLITASVWRKAPPGQDAEKFLVGTAPIDVTEIFADLLKNFRNTKGLEPMARSLSEKFDIVHDTGVALGKVLVFVRITCFGKSVITQFQSNFEDNSILFKDNEGRFLYKYQSSEQEETGQGKEGKAKKPPEMPCQCIKCAHEMCKKFAEAIQVKGEFR